MRHIACCAVLLTAALASAQDAGVRADAGRRGVYDPAWAAFPDAHPAGDARAPARPPAKLEDPSEPAPAPKPAQAQPAEPVAADAPAPRFTPQQRAEARRFLAAVFQASARGPLDCAQVVTPTTRLVLIAADLTAAEVAENSAGLVALTRCAEQQGYFGLMQDLAVGLLRHAGADAHPELLARAFLGLGSPRAAMEVLETADKKLPNLPDVALTKAKVFCRVRMFAECRALADKAAALGRQMKSPAERDAVVNRALKYRARADLHLGDLDAALAGADASEKLGGDVGDLEAVRASVLEARHAGAVLDVEVEDLLPLGTYHLVGKVEGVQPLVELALIRLGKEPIQYRVEAEVPGVTGRFSQTLLARPGKEQRVTVHPPLLPGFDPTSVRAARQVQADVVISAIEAGGERQVWKQSVAVTLQPRDFLPLATFRDKEGSVGSMVSEFIGAWVTPNARAVDAFLKSAKRRAPGASFAGEQAPTFPQVQALYDELQSRGVSYVMDPEQLAADGVKGQRTRLPSEVLASTNAQCLEGAILYATLFEAIGLRSAIVLVPGHAFVGWGGAGKLDGVDGDTWFFLETTLTHDAPFERAVRAAAEQFRAFSAKKATRVVPIPKLRKLGVTPQPYDA